MSTPENIILFPFPSHQKKGPKGGAMSFDVSPWVEEGSIRQEGYHLEGMLKFSHLEHPILLRLIGCGGGALDGCSFYFWNSDPRSSEPFPIPHLSRRQAGPAGQLALGQIEVSEEPDEENPEPQYRANRLLMEWCGQNGFMKIMLENQTVEFLKGNQPCQAPQRLLGSSPDPSPSVLEGLLPRITPRTSERRRVAASPIDEIRELDQAIESQQPGVPIISLFDPPYEGRELARLSNEGVDLEIKVILAQLARIGVCIELCEHLGPRELLAMLIDEVLGQPIHVSEFLPIHGMEHFDTYSICAACQKELEEEMECPGLRSKATPNEATSPSSIHR